MKSRLAALLAPLLLALTPLASASVIGFDGQPIGAYPGGTATISVDGVDVRFTGTGLQIRNIAGAFPSPGATRVLSTADDVEPITLQFLNGVTVDGLGFRNWISGVYTLEVDTIRAEAFDASSVSLGVVTSSAEFVTLPFSGISRVVFDDVGGTGYVLDEISFNGTVPEPGTLALLGLGLAGLAAARRRKQ
jgi:hypothetical protein